MRPANAYKSANPKTGEVCILKVSGMFCGACAKTVEKTVKKIDGVKTAKVSDGAVRGEYSGRRHGGVDRRL